jgi:hypothetical protein
VKIHIDISKIKIVIQETHMHVKGPEALSLPALFSFNIEILEKPFVAF